MLPRFLGYSFLLTNLIMDFGGRENSDCVELIVVGVPTCGQTPVDGVSAEMIDND
jgi:hypothetical protein